MNRGTKSSERGQALVLIVLALIAMLGFTALAVDGGMIFADRRYAQSAADSSSLAGGGVAAIRMEKLGVNYKNWTATSTSCTGQVALAGKAARAAAVRRAKDNGFEIDQNIVDNMGVVTECGVEPIYVKKANGDMVKIFDDKYMDVRTMIRKQTDTTFSHFVNNGPMINVVTATTRVRPRQPLAYGFAIVALNDAPCQGLQNGVIYHGLNQDPGGLSVNGGGVWSNGCMDSNGQVHVEVNDGAVNYFNTNNLSNITMNPSGTPNQLYPENDNRLPPETYNLPLPNCDGHEVSPSFIVNYSKTHTDPVTHQPLPIPSGLYCITGDIMINAQDVVKAIGVTLVPYGRLIIDGNAEVNLSAPPNNYVGPAMAGVLIYSPPTNTSEIRISGNQLSSFSGTILAPGGTVDLSGNAMTSAFTCQVIAWNVQVGGSSVTNLTFQDGQQTTKPAAIDLYR